MRLPPFRAHAVDSRTDVWVDVALASALTLTGQLELAHAGQAGLSGLAHGLLVAAQTAPLAIRRLVPAVAALIGAAALSLESLATTPTNTLSGLLAGLVLVYTVGRWVSGRWLIAVTGLTALALALHTLRLPHSQVEDLAFAAIFAGTAWLAGRTFRRRELERAQAAAQARAQQEAADAALTAAVVEERARIARELHDVVAHGMGVMVVQAAAAEQLLHVDPSAAVAPLSAVRETGQGALAEMRRLLGLLRTGDVEESAPQPGLRQLPGLVESLRGGGLPVTLAVSGSERELPDGLQLCAYRIVQEALTNGVKHASGAPASIELHYTDAALEIRVLTGRGAPAEAAATGAGHGLVGMRERTRLYGGSLDAGPCRDGGFLVHATLPRPR
ncbi:MAG: sensor histidine kinase [Actinomycetales bacterium]